jgi:hypothetical protein
LLSFDNESVAISIFFYLCEFYSLILDEVEVTCTAGATTFLIEFGLLTRLTGIEGMQQLISAFARFKLPF